MAKLGTLLLASLGVLLLAFATQVALAQERFTREVNFDIAAQSVEAALIEFSKQAGVQVMVGGALNGQTTEGVKGKLSVTDALRQLLKNTGLEYRAEGNTVTIRSNKNARADATVRPLVAGTTLASRDGAAEAATRNPSSAATAEPSAQPRVDPLAEVIVTGTRLSGQSTLPVQVFDRQKLDQLGVSTLPDVLRYLSQQSYTFSEFRNFGGAQFVELRGLGVDSSLVLINGRRTIPSAPNVAFNAFDLNTIPLMAVERVEILSDSASAVYGADAISGVINVILKREIDRPIVDLHYGSAEGGGEERRASVAAGHSGERFRASLVLDYFDRDFLLGGERERWNNQDYTRFDSLDWRSQNSNPGNVRSRTAGNLPGLPSRTAAVPVGSTGVGLTPADFLATAGTSNLDSLWKYRSVVPKSERSSASATAELDLFSTTTAFLELLYVDRENQTQSEPSTLSPAAVVPATNPFNPFGVPVSVGYLFEGVGPRHEIVESDLFRAAGGLRGKLASWDWEVSALHTDDDGASWTENAVDLGRVIAALADTNPASSLNVFQDGPGATPEVLRSLVAEPVRSSYASKGNQFGAFLRGSPLELPAGELELVVGGETRTEDVLLDSGATKVSHDRRVSAAFAEIRVPVISSEMDWPAMHALTLTIAARQDHYSDFGDTFNPQFGLLWQPVSSLAVRLSRGSSFRPPSLVDLFLPRTSGIIFPVVDPRRNGEVANADITIGGNPNLEPIEGESWSGGLVFTPNDAVRLSATYWHVEVDQRIQSFDPQLIVENEGLFSDRIVRLPPSAADIAAGLPGAIAAVDISQINFGLLETSGIDMGMSFHFDTALGRLAPELSLTWIDKYTAVDAPQTPSVDRLGKVSLQGTVPKWRAVASLAWDWRGVGASVTGRYTPSYDDADLFGDPNGRTIGSQFLMDAQARLDLGQFFQDTQPWLGGFRLTAGVFNVLDKEPHFSERFSLAGYDVSQGDLRGRFGYLKLTKQF